MRAAATRRARKGTVSNPTTRARNNAVKAKIAVASGLPRSRATEENTAAVNASPSPATAIKNRCHASRSMFAIIDLNICFFLLLSLRLGLAALFHLELGKQSF